ncbi:MAG: Dihydroorotate dehydrogenase (quinone), mitochondrial, partial [Vezdaea acicularis]
MAPVRSLLRSLHRPVTHSPPTNIYFRRIPLPNSPVHFPRASRFASTTATEARSLVTRLKNLFYGTAIILFSTLSYLYITDTRASVHRWLVPSTLRLLYPDAEESHAAGTTALKTLHSIGLHPRERAPVDEHGELETDVFGHKLRNPLATSAGLDKGGEIPTPLLLLGPSIVEIGGITPFPQPGNPRPRVFRLPSQDALINRYGLNSEGADAVARRLRKRVRLFAQGAGFGAGPDGECAVLDGEAGVAPGSLMPGSLLAVQVAKSKDTDGTDIEAVRRDYVYCVERLAPYADILVVNVSSPNTPGLRNLQRVEPLKRILEGVVQAAKGVERKRKPRVMVKVSPDEDTEEQVRGVCEAVWEAGVDGVVVGNTTNSRPVPDGTISQVEADTLKETGGYSGPSLFEKTVDLVRRYREILDKGPPTKENPKDAPTEAPANALKEKPKEDTNREQPPKNPPPFQSTLQPPTSEPHIDPLQGSPIPASHSSASQSLIQLPSRHTSSSSSASPQVTPQKLSQTTTPPSPSPPSPKPQPPSPSPEHKGDRKVIFATGGITTGAQAQQVLDAG